MCAFVEEVPINQPFFLEACFDPIAFEIVKTFDVVGVIGIKKRVSIFSRLNRHAIARQHVKMGRAWKGVYRCFNGIDRGLNQRPSTPAAFYPLSREYDIWVIFQRGFDLGEVFGLGTRIKVDRHIVADSGQSFRLIDDRFGIFVTQEDEGDFCHFGN